MATVKIPAAFKQLVKKSSGFVNLASLQGEDEVKANVLGVNKENTQLEVSTSHGVIGLSPYACSVLFGNDLAKIQDSFRFKVEADDKSEFIPPSNYSGWKEFKASNKDNFKSSMGETMKAWESLEDKGVLRSKTDKYYTYPSKVSRVD